jgi:hypothetical protein
VNAVMNLRIPYNAGNFLSGLELISFSGMTLLHEVSIFSVICKIILPIGAFWLRTLCVEESALSGKPVISLKEVLH